VLGSVDPGLLAVSPQVSAVINQAVGSHYFLPRSAVTFSPKEHHCPLASTKLCCL